MTHNRSPFNGPYPYPKDEYVCSHYRHNSGDCTMHFIRTAAAEEIILASIRRVSEYVRSNEAKFIEKLRESSHMQHEQVIKESKKQLAKSTRRRGELDTLVKKLYESYATGKMPEEHYTRLLADYDTERTETDRKIADLQNEVDTFHADSVRAEKFIKLVQKYTQFTELSTVMLHEFVEKVLVHEGDKSSGKRVQKVDVYFNFIGHFDASLPPQTEALLCADPSLFEKRRKRNIYQKQWRERKRKEAMAQA
jgi:hypothetical protein